MTDITHKQLGEVSLLDVPTTIAWALGVQPPSSYVGRVVVDPFEADVDAEVEIAVA